MPHVPKRQECDLDKLKECLTIRHNAKWARKDYHHIEILLSSHGGRKEESRGAIVGVTDRGAHTNIHVGPKAQSKEEPLLGQVWPRTKGTAYH